MSFPRFRFLQTVIRDLSEQKGNSTYRYDLLADCKPEEPHYIIRAHRSVFRENGDPCDETASVASPIYGDESEIRNVFLDIAHADRPVDPVHLDDILQDSCTAGVLQEQKLQSSHSLDQYHSYDESWGRR
ncbi:MAG: hypothetical protein R6U70_03255 [Bacillota bacterium]